MTVSGVRGVGSIQLDKQKYSKIHRKLVVVCSNTPWAKGPKSAKGGCILGTCGGGFEKCGGVLKRLTISSNFSRERGTNGDHRLVQARKQHS
jgi:hypothetical protein